MNATTRRKFLKRSGGASVAAMVAWTLATKDAGAEDEGDNSSKGSGCPQKTTRTNHGTFTLRRVDIWRRHPNTKNGSSFYLRTAGVPTVIAGSQPPGAFPDEISFVKNGKICNYVKESTAPVIVSNPQTPNWVFSSGNHPGPSYSGDALPNPAADWQGENVVVQATYSASQAWSATQSSILQ